ncbi:cytochrome b ascorbate-dependent protein 3 [Diplogelasinospora grovesii]|uniref:Cytochrome b ascorbate-dependent protein 3 n=1 Tax=Diplogelasinospora grovesii TaxID=303347 RepID=A0AAN6NGV9_9PEZI|nr:cytochrome b ascorbate-dependent protein 3 [Diplogelasinospora grovesii]
MSSPTASEHENHAPTETEPLLGRPGDALQKPDAPLIHNLWLGTGWIAQVGGLLLLGVVWAAVFTHPLLPLVSPHPLLQSFGIFMLLQAILVLQPTYTPETKLHGQRAHASFHLFSFLLFAAGITIIEVNKGTNSMAHFHSVHAYLGVITGAVLLVQYIFGFLMWGVPGVFGGVEKAKALWKYHRYSGYLLLVLVLATVTSATKTDYSKGVLDIKTWSVLIADALILIGVLPRIQLAKLGIQRPAATATTALQG